MPNLVIPLNSGIDNFSDGEEVGVKGNLNLENVYINTPGKIIQRPYASDLITIPNLKIHQVKRWANPDISFNEFGWIVVCEDLDYNLNNNLNPSQKQIRLYNRDFSLYQFVTLTDVNPSKIEILENVALFTMGVGDESLRYRYVNMDFFDKLHSFNGWHLDIGRPRNTFVTIKSVSSNAGGGKLEDNKYFFYKVVPVFNMNPRCHSIDIYRASGTTELEDDLNYYKIKSISTVQPLSQTGAINDFSNISMSVVDNGSFYDSGASAEYSPDDWMCILQPQHAQEPLLSNASSSDFTMIRLFNPTNGTEEYPQARRESNIAPTQYATGDTLPLYITNSDEDMPWYDKPSYLTQYSYTKDVYPIIGFNHTQADGVNDNASDTALLGAKLRQTSHNSAGDKNWVMVKRENKIIDGNFMHDYPSTNWTTSVPYSMTSGVPNDQSGDVSWFNNGVYANQGGHKRMWFDYQRPQMVAVFDNTLMNMGGRAYASDDGSAVNNCFMQTVTLEAGKKYWVQYSFQWCIGDSAGSHQNKQWVRFKLSTPNGAYNNGSNNNWISNDNVNGIFHHEYNSGTRHRQSGTNVLGNYEKGWWNYSQIFTATAGGDYTFNMWLHSRVDYAYSSFGSVLQCLRLKDVGIFEVDERANYYAGNRVIIPNGYTNSDPANPTNPAISTNDYQGGNVFVGDTKLSIETNVNTVFELEDVIPSSYIGSSPEVLITKGLNTSKTNENGREVLNLEFNDIGYSSVQKHQSHETPINVKYEFSQYIEGRMFVANCRYTNEQYDDVEQDSNLVLFSELNQPNVIPVTNYIKCQDNQGGNITGLGELMGNLVVFLEDSIWRINVPSTDPNAWSLVESSKELGCTSKSSIVSYEDGIFFANKEGIWGLSQNFMPKEISKLWREHYQANYDNHTLIHYCPKSHMLYVNQNNPYETWVLDVNNDNQSTAWLKLVEKGGGSEMSGYSGFMVDETSKSFFFENRENSCVIGELEPKKGNYKSGMTKKTGWIRLGDLDKKSMVRRINIRYKNKYEGSDFAPDLNIYVDGADNATFTKLGDDLFLDKTGNEAIASLRCGVRCKYFSIELSTSSNTDIESDIENMFELLSFEVEWE